METKINISPEDIFNSLAKIQSNVSCIKEHIEDINLSEDDLNAINEARQDLKEGKTRRL